MANVERGVSLVGTTSEALTTLTKRAWAIDSLLRLPNDLQRRAGELERAISRFTVEVQADPPRRAFAA